MQLVPNCKILYCSDLNSLCETGIGNFLIEAEAEYQQEEALVRTGVPGARPASTQGLFMEKPEVRVRNSSRAINYFSWLLHEGNIPFWWRNTSLCTEATFGIWGDLLSGLIQSHESQKGSPAQSWLENPHRLACGHFPWDEGSSCRGLGRPLLPKVAFSSLDARSRDFPVPCQQDQRAPCPGVWFCFLFFLSLPAPWCSLVHLPAWLCHTFLPASLQPSKDLLTFDSASLVCVLCFNHSHEYLL